MSRCTVKISLCPLLTSINLSHKSLSTFHNKGKIDTLADHNLFRILLTLSDYLALSHLLGFFLLTLQYLLEPMLMITFTMATTSMPRETLLNIFLIYFHFMCFSLPDCFLKVVLLCAI